MSSIAVFKWAVNPEDAIVRDDGTVGWNMAKPAVSDDDHAAVQAACDASPDSAVRGLTMADRDISFAAARDAEFTYAIEGLDPLADSTTLSCALAAAVRTIGDADVVAIGDGEWQPAVPATLAGILGWPVVLQVDAVQPEGDGLRVTRRFMDGTQDVFVKKPCVLGVTARRQEQNVPGMRAVLAARKKPSAVLSADDLLADRPLPSPASNGTRLPDATESKIYDGADPDAAVKQLVCALRADGTL